MKLSRTVAYALQATLQLAQAHSASPVPCSRLAAAGKMPERFLLQILRTLVAHGILQSTRGVEGGYSLHRRANEITLLEVIEAIDGPLVASFPFGEGLPEETRDKLDEALSGVTSRLRDGLGRVSLADLLPSDQQGEPLPEAAGRAAARAIRRP